MTNSLGTRAVPAHEDSDSAFGHKGGALGWGAGAAIGVALAFPDRRIVCTLGDGSLMYCPQAMYTAARQKLPILYLVMNNGGYAIIKSGTRAQKQRAYETDTYIGMDITDPEVDFVSLARGLGLGSAAAANPEELNTAVKNALSHDGPFLIDCKLDRRSPTCPSEVTMARCAGRNQRTGERCKRVAIQDAPTRSYHSPDRRSAKASRGDAVRPALEFERSF